MRKIALVTTSRADYGIQSRLIHMLQERADVDFSLIVSGTHLSMKHGMTVKEIENDGIKISHKLNIGIDEESDISRIMARAILGFSSVLSSLKPDICVLLGDRYEMFAASVACTLNNIPIAHIHGGESTQGLMDEVFRHSMTKAAHLHFVSCEMYRNRVIQLGESPDRVFNVGSMGVENIRAIPKVDKETLSNDLKIELSRRNILVTFHPVTLEADSAADQVKELLGALSQLDETTIVFTHPNADVHGDALAAKIKTFVNQKPRSYLFKSLGMFRYAALARIVDAVVGNSSSGIIEVPSLGTPTVNIGDRQKGRMHGSSVIDCPCRQSDISRAINDAFALKSDDAVLLEQANPYYKDNAAQNILDLLCDFDLNDILKKKFYDVGQNACRATKTGGIVP